MKGSVHIIRQSWLTSITLLLFLSFCLFFFKTTQTTLRRMTWSGFWLILFLIEQPTRNVGFSKSIASLNHSWLVFLVHSCIFKLVSYKFLVAVKLYYGGFRFLLCLNLNFDVFNFLILHLVLICTHFRQSRSPLWNMLVFETFKLSCQEAWCLQICPLLLIIQVAQTYSFS